MGNLEKQAKEYEKQKIKNGEKYFKQLEKDLSKSEKKIINTIKNNYKKIFDCEYYLDKYKDVKEEYGNSCKSKNAFNHWVHIGRNEGRYISQIDEENKPKTNIHDDTQDNTDVDNTDVDNTDVDKDVFHCESYLTRYNLHDRFDNDCEAAKEYYLTEGKKNGHDASPEFNCAAYVKRYGRSRVGDNCTMARTHYDTTGRFQNLDPCINSIPPKKEEKKESKWNKSNTSEKIDLIIQSILSFIFDFTSDLIIFCFSVFSVFYLYFVLDKKNNIKTSSLYPSERDKFPYVFFDENKSASMQEYITTTNTLQDVTLDAPFFKNVNFDAKKDGVSEKEFIRQDKENNNINSMNWASRAFNYYCKDKKSYELGAVELFVFILASGIISCNYWFGQIHNMLKDTFNISGGSSSINNCDVLNENDSIMSNFSIKGLFKLFTLLFILCCFLFFRTSKDDFKDLVAPFLNKNLSGFKKFGLNKESNNKNKTNHSFGINEVFDFISSFFSGFFSIIKIIFIFSYIFFILSTGINLFLVCKSSKSTYIAILSLLIGLSFIINVFFMIFALFQLFTSDSSTDVSSFTHQWFNKLVSNVAGSIKSVKIYVNDTLVPFFKSIFSRIAGKDSNMLTMILGLLSLPFLLAFLPIMMIPLLLLIYMSIAAIIPFIGSISPAFNVTKNFTLNWFFNLNKVIDPIINNRISLVILFIISLGLIYKTKLNKIKEPLDLIRIIVSNIFISGIAVFILNQQKDDESSKKYNQISTILKIFIILSALYEIIVSSLKLKNNM